ncbi:MAG: YdcF family protein [Candidatus Margulisbacteria bacterium]|nr:YdcF family protein [Candidatus Margulisiibacteriota bacterium]
MKEKIRFVLLFLLLIFIVYVSRILISFPFTPERLIFSHPLEKADLIVVPSGEMVRLEHAFKLAEQGYAPVVFYSGGYIDNYKGEYIRKLQVKGVELIVTSNSISTYTDAVLTKAFIKDKNIHKIILVTSPYHSYRVYKTFHKLIPDKKLISVPAVGSEFNVSDAKYKKNSFSQLSFRSEQLKYLFYAIKYGI